MKKIMAILMLAIFVLSVAPSALAREQAQTAASGNAPTPVLISADVSPAAGGEAAAVPVSSTKPTITSTVRERLQNLRQAAATIATKVQDIREYQKEKLQAALELCDENSDDPEACKETLRGRINKVESLTDKGLEVLQNIEARKDQAISRWKELQKNQEIVKFRVKAAKGLKARLLSSNAVETARAKYNQAKQNYELAKQNYDSAKGAFDRAKTALEACDPEAEDCAQLEAGIREEAKSYMLNVLSRIEEQLNKASAKVEESDSLTDEEAAAELARIQEKLASLQELKSEVEAITGETLKDDISGLARRISALWAEKVKSQIVKTAGFLQTARMGGVYVQLEKLSQRLEDVLARMAEQGKDTSSAETLIDSFNSGLGSAKSAYLEAVGKFKEAASATDTESRQAALTEAQAKMREAQSALSDARELLKDIVQELRGQGALDELEDDSAAESLEEVEELAAAE